MWGPRAFPLHIHALVWLCGCSVCCSKPNRSSALGVKPKEMVKKPFFGARPCGCQSCSSAVLIEQRGAEPTTVPGLSPAACPLPAPLLSDPWLPVPCYFFPQNQSFTPFFFYPKSNFGFSIPSPCQLWSIPSLRVLPIPPLPLELCCRGPLLLFFPLFPPFFPFFPLFFPPCSSARPRGI